MWSTASRAHLNCDFRFNSQPLAITFTTQRSIGGRTWPNVNFDNLQFDHVFTLWGNNTLGLLSYWWHANRQVAGRGEMTITSAESLPLLDFRPLSDEQLATAEAIFEGVPGQGAKARLPGRRRHQPRPAGLRRGHLRGSPPPRRQVLHWAGGVVWRARGC